MIFIDVVTLERTNALACFRVTAVVTNCCIRLYQTLFFHPHKIKKSLARETKYLGSLDYIESQENLIRNNFQLLFTYIHVFMKEMIKKIRHYIASLQTSVCSVDSLIKTKNQVLEIEISYANTVQIPHSLKKKTAPHVS